MAESASWPAGRVGKRFHAYERAVDATADAIYMLDDCGRAAAWQADDS